MRLPEKSKSEKSEEEKPIAGKFDVTRRGKTLSEVFPAENLSL